MFERAPFHRCPICKSADTLGFLSAGGGALTRRCTACRSSTKEPLPELDKKVVYLDQFAVSSIFKIKRGLLKPNSNSFAFWERAERAVNRAYLLQQAIFPSSHIHSDETIVWTSGAELGLAHEMLGGDTSFRRLDEIALQQIVPFAQAFQRGEMVPTLEFNVDSVLTRARNDWISHLHVSVNSDYSRFAPGIRNNRDKAAVDFGALAEAWRREKPTFKAALRTELQAFATANVDALARAHRRYEAAKAEGDILELFEAAHSTIYVQFLQLRSLFESAGVPPERSADEVLRYWRWSGNDWLPHHRIACYIFAGIARKMGAGQRRPPGRGMLNDIDAIAYFAPYVDAMLVDRECAGLLRENPLNELQHIRAKIFSMTTGEEFIRYLDGLSDNASPETKHYAFEIYGIS